MGRTRGWLVDDDAGRSPMNLPNSVSKRPIVLIPHVRHEIQTLEKKRHSPESESSESEGGKSDATWKPKDLRPRSGIQRTLLFQTPMSGVPKTEKTVRKRTGTNANRTPRKFTERRKKIVKVFMAKAAWKPEKYGEIGAKSWIAGLLRALGEPEKGPNEDDVKTWLKKEPGFFEKLRRQFTPKARVEMDERRPRTIPATLSSVEDMESGATTVVCSNRDVDLAAAAAERVQKTIGNPSGPTRNSDVTIIPQNDLAGTPPVITNLGLDMIAAWRKLPPTVVISDDNGKITVMGEYGLAQLRVAIDSLEQLQSNKS